MKVTGIYKITSPNHRVYIGQSVDVYYRWNRYYYILNCKGQPLLYRSLKKHGVDNHKFEIIEECDVNKLNERERYWQDYYDVLNGGLNLKLTETNDKLCTHSALTIEKISKSAKERLKDKTNHPMYGISRKGIYAPMYGKYHSQDTRSKISKSKKGKQIGELNHFFGKNHTDDFKRMHSEARLMGNNPNAKKIIDIDTNIVYDCIKKASESLNIPYSSLKIMLKNKIFNKTSLRYFDN